MSDSVSIIAKLRLKNDWTLYDEAADVIYGLNVELARLRSIATEISMVRDENKRLMQLYYDTAHKLDATALEIGKLSFWMRRAEKR